MVLLSYCGSAERQPPVPASGLSLEIHFPGALSRTEARRARFELRANRLELQLRSKSGVKETVSYNVGQWDHIAINQLAFPASTDDRLNITGRVWDLQRDGTQRPYPALSGSAYVKAAEMAQQGPTVIPLRLSLRVPVSEYD